mgnify:CR=1 FL=1
MKSEKGITITSLIVYIIGMVIVVAIMSVITTNFYKNVNSMTLDINPTSEYTRFNSNFSEEVNAYNIKVLECKSPSTDTSGTDQNYIAFDNGTQYTYVPENKAIYKNKVKICRNVELCIFTTSIQNGKDVVTVQLQIDGKQYNNTYTLKR